MANGSDFSLSKHELDLHHFSNINSHSLGYSELYGYDNSVSLPMTDAKKDEFEFQNESKLWIYNCDDFKNLTAWMLYCVNNTSEMYVDPSNDYYFNENANSDGASEVNFALPWWQQLIWSLFFCGMVVVATGGNLIVIWIVCTNKRMRSVTNYFLVNLSIADIMVSTLNVIFNLYYMITRDWPFGEVYCKISNFVSIISVSASVFTMMAISIDR